MARRETKVVRKMIQINGPLARHRIVRKVVNTFIATEYCRKGKGIEFRYSVEKFVNGKLLYIIRPGHKKNFDFKVDVPTNYGLGKGSHEEIALNLRVKCQINPKNFKNLWQAITEIYHCRESDVNIVLKRKVELKKPFRDGANPEVLLKVIKWLFIMEDIVYWDNEGRAFLFNFFNYVVNEKDENRLREALEKVKNPDRLRSFMRKSNVKWVPYGG